MPTEQNNGGTAWVRVDGVWVPIDLTHQYDASTGKWIDTSLKNRVDGNWEDKS